MAVEFKSAWYELGARSSEFIFCEYLCVKVTDLLFHHICNSSAQIFVETEHSLIEIQLNSN